MKTNLDSIFKTDTSLENDGVKFEISEGLYFILKRYGGSNITAAKKALQKYYKPHAKQLEMGVMDEKVERDISYKIFIDVCMIDWKGVELDGVEVPFNAENALKLFRRLPELYNTLQAHAADMINFKEDLGNS